MTAGTRVVALVLATVAWGACRDASNPGTTTVVDSAGVRITTNLPGSIEAAEAWSLSSEPVVEIGAGVTPDVPLYQVTAVVPLDDGRVAVGTNTPPQALVFEPDGTLAATLGREGEGPGEFAAVASVVPLGGDSLAVWDPNRRRMSVFSEDGRFLRDVDLSGLVPLSPIAAPSTRVPAGWTYLLPSSSGSLVVLAIGVWGSGVPERGAYRMELASHRIDASGTELASYGPFPGQELYTSAETGLVPLPFGADTYGTTSGDALVVGTAESPELRLYAADGALERIVRWPGHDRAVAEGPLRSDFNTWLDAQLARRAPGEQAMLRELIDAIPEPESFPAYAGIISGDTGEIWIGEYPGQLGVMGFSPEVRRMPARRWLVFDAAGALAASVRTPEGFQPYAVRGERVWGVFTDELDIESIRAYEVVKG